ncbi:GNAT family N-acetyltransferase [uncultured Tateyamaria sp.]|uniref:GNAT family N-acetyltransferase n=1 Tax=uncultured Tateyamaria sp. TaxID=455651 RepID=UPI00261C9B96|nr:GNAT family N-acetyltransferase [uncultured Tateyamaria sp.]
MRLTTQSTTLRRLSPDDLRAFQAYRNDPVVAQFQSWEAMDDDRAAGFLTHAATSEPLFTPGHWTQIAVADAETDALLGDMGLHLSQDQTEAELGITLARAAQGQGHATRAVALAVGLLFDETPIDRIRAWADIRNMASQNLMVRAGFTEIGIEVTDGVTEAAFVRARADV